MAEEQSVLLYHLIAFGVVFVIAGCITLYDCLKAKKCKHKSCEVCKPDKHQKQK